MSVAVAEHIALFGSTPERIGCRQLLSSVDEDGNDDGDEDDEEDDDCVIDR